MPDSSHGVEKQHLLNSKQMAKFVADGFLRFDHVVPPELNDEAVREMDGNKMPWDGYRSSGTPFETMWRESKGLGEVFRLPAVRGIIHSLVGPNPTYDHHAVHVVPGNHRSGQIWHADAIIDTRMHFDVQLFYFAHDTPREMGGTMILPGSHLRRVSESDIARHQNFKNQLPMVCDAGTIMVCHHGMWHCAQPNLTDRKRYMFKLRLNPTVKQVRLWNTDDIDDTEVRNQLSADHGWYGNEVRLEQVNRIKLWRFLTGDEKFDLGYWMGRLENQPEKLLSA